MGWNDIVLFVMLSVAFYTDVKDQRLPNLMTIGGTGIGLCIHSLVAGLNGMLFASTGLLVGGGIVLILYYFKAIGAGDVKLFAAIGALTGPEFVLYAIMYAVICAGLISLFLVVMRRKIKQFPFMYAVLPGMLLTYYYF